MSKSFRYHPEEDWDTQINAKQRRQLRKADKQARQGRDHDTDFNELEETEESANPGM